MATLLVLETLTPTERAVFVLREVFDLPHDEIAGALDKASAAVQQAARRARVHVASRRPRQEVSQARRNPITGVDAVSRFLKGLSRRLGEGMSLHPVQVNAQPALLLRSDDGIDTVVTARLDHGVISALYAVRNPEKLVHVEHERAMNR